MPTAAAAGMSGGSMKAAASSGLNEAMPAKLRKAAKPLPALPAQAAAAAATSCSNRSLSSGSEVSSSSSAAASSWALAAAAAVPPPGAAGPPGTWFACASSPDAGMASSAELLLSAAEPCHCATAAAPGSESSEGWAAALSAAALLRLLAAARVRRNHSSPNTKPKPAAIIMERSVGATTELQPRSLARFGLGAASQCAAREQVCKQTAQCPGGACAMLGAAPLSRCAAGRGWRPGGRDSHCPAT